MSKEYSAKYYGCRQETLIASYLGWDVVSGSGARDFHPGDIISDRFLGECKTHISKQDKIYFDADVWEKIQNEAMSKFRVPILFTDNGSQSIEHTWCILPKRFVISCDKLSELESSDKFVHSSKNLNLKDSALMELFSNRLEDSYISIEWCNQPMAIMNIKAFKYFIEV